jgi:hypothetical protein
VCAVDIWTWSLPLTHSSSTSETARIFVGDDPDPFLINADLICNASPYFAKAFRGEFSEAESMQITLQQVDRSTVSDFLDWVRAAPKPRTIRQSVGERPPSPPVLEHPVKLAPLVRLWVFADKHRVPKLQNQAMYRIASLYPHYDGCNIQPSLIDYVYHNSQSDSPLRRIMVDFAATKMDPGFYSENVSDLHVEFLEDLCLTQMQLAREGSQGSLIYALQYYVSENLQDLRDPNSWQQREARDSTVPHDLRQSATAGRLAERQILVPRRPRQPKQKTKYPFEL